MRGSHCNAGLSGRQVKRRPDHERIEFERCPGLVKQQHDKRLFTERPQRFLRMQGVEIDSSNLVTRRCAGSQGKSFCNT